MDPPLFSCVWENNSSSNSLVLDPWRAFWADLAPFKGPQPWRIHCFGTTEIQGHCRVWRARRGGPMTPLRTTDTDLNCRLKKMHLFSLWSKDWKGPGPFAPQKVMHTWISATATAIYASQKPLPLVTFTITHSGTSGWTFQCFDSTSSQLLCLIRSGNISACVLKIHGVIWNFLGLFIVWRNSQPFDWGNETAKKSPRRAAM